MDNLNDNKIIQVANLTKKYSKVTAVDDITFSVDKGDIFAFLGPNGAGKSTAIKIITTVLRPTSGTIKINGHYSDSAAEKNRIRESIGVIFQDHTLDNELTAYENLYYHCVMYGVPKTERKDRIEFMMKNIGLWERKNEMVKTFSGGMKRRVEIVRGLLHFPEILILDEPTSGLDAQTRFFLWEHIHKINREQEVTIFITTHYMDEAEKVANNIAIIDKGKILALGSAKEIEKRTGTDSLEMAFLEITGYELR